MQNEGTMKQIPKSLSNVKLVSPWRDLVPHMFHRARARTRTYLTKPWYLSPDLWPLYYILYFSTSMLYRVQIVCRGECEWDQYCLFVGTRRFFGIHIFLHKDFQRALSYNDNQHTLVHYLEQFCRYGKVHCPNPWKLFYRTGFVTLNLIGNCNRICNFYKSKISNSCFQWVPTNHCCSTGHISTHKPVSSKSYKGPQWRHSCTI